MASEVLREYGPEHTLTWSLLMLLAMSKTGLSPAGNSVFHRLIFFANTLARLYSIQPPSEVVMRHPRGPFYPRAQSDLDRLCVMSLASVEGYGVRRHKDFVERHGTYDITDDGFSLASLLVTEVAWARRGYELILDLATAFAAMRAGFAEVAAGNDLTYLSPSIEDYPLIQFREFQRNLSARATRSLESMLPAPLRPIPQQSLRLYIRYLERLAA